MAKQRALTCMRPHVMLSLLIHLAELTFSAMLAVTLYRDVTHRDVFFALTAGLIIIPLVTVQLVSAIFLLRGQGDSMSGKEAGLMAAVHVLQMGVIWRQVALLKGGDDAARKRKDLRELLILKLIFTLTGGLPLVLVQLYLILTKAELSWSWVLYASLVASALSSIWSVASFQHQLGEAKEDTQSDLMSWPGSLFTFLWRVGELVSRTISLALFSNLYHQWVLLVLGFHWIVMMLCVSVPQTASSRWRESTLFRRVVLCLVTSYSYMWCYVSVGDIRAAAVWYTLYYVIMFLENGTLSVVWLTTAEEDSVSSRYLLVVISALAFLVAMVCLAVFHKLFQRHNTDTTSPSQHGAKAGEDLAQNGCSSCHHTANSKHSHCPQHGTPYCSVWMGQYRSALSAGNYYKHTIHDSLLDSASDLYSLTQAGSTKPLTKHCKAPHRSREGCGCCGLVGRSGAEGCVCRGEGDGGSVISGLTSRSGVSCPHQRCGKGTRSDLTETTSVLTLASGGSHNLGYEGCEDSQSKVVPAWLPAGDSLIARHLLSSGLHQGTAGTGVQSQHRTRQEKCAERYRCLLKQDAQRWASDGYSTDHTVLEWSRLPVTTLANNVWDINEPDTDCCTCCCNHLSQGDSEVSSIFRAAQTVHVGDCPDCMECCGAGDVVYGVPQKLGHLHHKALPEQNESSSDSEVCPCCVQPEKKQLGKSSVFTISAPDRSCPRDSHDCCRAKACVSESEGSHVKRDAVPKKTRHADKRRHRDACHSRPSKHDKVSGGKARSLPNTDSLSDTEASPDVTKVEDDSSQPVPSKLQVKAIAEKVVDDIAVKQTTGGSASSPRSEPIYENVSVFAQDNKTDNSVPVRTEDFPEKAVQKTEKSPVQDKTGKKAHKGEEPQKKHSKAKDLNEKKSLKNNKDQKIQPMKNKDVAMTRSTEHDTVTKTKPSRSDRQQRQWSGNGQEPWYVCSESEDSALPAETFSSSIEEGFTATDLDSDGSVELII